MSKDLSAKLKKFGFKMDQDKDKQNHIPLDGDVENMISPINLYLDNYDEFDRD